MMTGVRRQDLKVWGARKSGTPRPLLCWLELLVEKQIRSPRSSLAARCWARVINLGLRF